MNRDWEKIVFADDLEPCPDCGEPWCDQHDLHYADCSCFGPNQDDVDYKWIGETLYGKEK